MSIMICKECSAPIDTDFHEMYDDMCENCADDLDEEINYCPKDKTKCILNTQHWVTKPDKCYGCLKINKNL